MKKILTISSLLLSTAVFAAKVPEKFIVETVEDTPSLLLVKEKGDIVNPQDPGGAGSGDTTTKPTVGDRAEQAGRVIQVGRDMVALGEAIYDLVKKGKPTNTTEYAPISVVPRDPMTKEYVDPFELENFSMPVERNYTTSIKSLTGGEAVQFKYKVVYSYGGSFNGTGKYLTSVMIVPTSIKTSFGWDFSASMRLGGIMNNGTKADPVAGVMLTVKYQMNSWSTAFERNDTIYINGRGELKNMSVK